MFEGGGKELRLTDGKAESECRFVNKGTSSLSAKAAASTLPHTHIVEQDQFTF